MKENSESRLMYKLLSIIVVTLLGITMLVGGMYYIYNNYDIGLNNDPEIVNQKPDQVMEEQEKSESSVAITIEKPKPFNYIPIEPKNGKLRAVIELGAEGFNYFVIELDKKGNWKKIKYKWGLSLLYESKEAVTPDEAVKRIRQAVSDIQRKTKAKNIHFLVSSGALNIPTTKGILKAVKNKYVVEEITEKKEAKLAFYSAVPKSFRKKSYVVDIGSGDTKIAWLDDDDKIITKSTLGSKYYKHEVSNREVYDNVKAKANDIPESRRKYCFIIGGAPYKLAKKTRKNKEDRYTVLYYPEDYLENYQKYGVKLEGKKVESGINIYKAIFDATKTKQFIFDWDANFTIGYLLKRG